MYGSLPIAYLIKKNATGGTKWYLKRYDAETLTCLWTAKSIEAHIFSSESGCSDYIAKYLSNRNCVIDKRIINPYAYAMGYGG